MSDEKLDDKEELPSHAEIKEALDGIRSLGKQITAVNIQRITYLTLLMGLIENHKINLSYESRITLLDTIVDTVVDYPSEYDSDIHETIRNVRATVESENLIKKSLNG